MSSCDGWAPAVGADGSSSAVCNPLLAGSCWLLGLYTLSKLPFYLCVPPPAHGLETGASLGFLAGFRGAKLFADPLLFLAPHASMLSTILLTLALFLAGQFPDLAARAELARWFFPLVLAFALHLLPVRGGSVHVFGIPNEALRNLPINEVFAAACIGGSCWGLHGLRAADDSVIVRSFWLCSLVGGLLAPLVDLLATARFVVARLRTGAWPVLAASGSLPIKEVQGQHSLWRQPTEGECVAPSPMRGRPAC